MSAVGSRGTLGPLLYDVNEACSLLGVKRTFLFTLIASGQLKSVKIGRLRKVTRVDLEAYIEQRRQENANETHR